MLKPRLMFDLLVVAMSLALYLLITAPLWGFEPASYHRCEHVEVLDGDTLKADYQLFGTLWARGETLRADFDAWETSRSRRSEPFRSFTEDEWREELAKGNQAKAALQSLLETNTLYISPQGATRGLYGRTTAKWYAWDGERLIDVGAWMRERRHLRDE